jgi:hypothetical protein
MNEDVQVLLPYPRPYDSAMANTSVSVSRTPHFVLLHRKSQGPNRNAVDFLGHQPESQPHSNPPYPPTESSNVIMHAFDEPNEVSVFV